MIKTSDKQRGYPLNSQMAVIGNAMGEEKELYLYGTSKTISGSDAYKVSRPIRRISVC